MRRFFHWILAALSEARWLTRERLLLAGSTCAFVTISLLGVCLVTDFDGPGLTNSTGEHFGHDFGQFWSSAQLAAAGNPAAAYVLRPHQTIDQVFPYPPVVMLLCRPLAGMSYEHALLLWSGLGLALFASTLARLVGWKMAVFAALGAPAALLNLSFQQNGYYLGALLGGGLMLLERRPTFAGIILGMLCCKPQLGILVAPALIAGRHWRAIFAAALTGLGLIAISAILFGPEIWIDFLARTASKSRWLPHAVWAWPFMPTVFAMMRLIGASVRAAYLLQALSTISAAAGVVLLWRGRGSLAIKSAGLVAAAFLATPYAWAYDTVILTFAAAWLGKEAAQSGFRRWEKMCVLVLLTLPALSLVPARLLGLQIGPILLWLVLAVVMRRGLGWRYPAAFLPLRGLPSSSAAPH